MDRERAASVAVDGTMVVLGGRDGSGDDILSFERYDPENDVWETRPEWDLQQGRYR